MRQHTDNDRQLHLSLSGDDAALVDEALGRVVAQLTINLGEAAAREALGADVTEHRAELTAERDAFQALQEKLMLARLELAVTQLV